MKTLSKVVKGLLVIMLFTGTSTVLSTLGISAVSEAHASVSYQQVYTYLTGNGYTVNSQSPIYGSDNWQAYTIKGGINYRTIVYVQGTNIVAHDDVVV